jgi:hypothetical protein
MPKDQEPIEAGDTCPCRSAAEDRERIAALPLAYFEPLFTLLPALEGPWPPLGKCCYIDARGVLVLSPPGFSPVVEALHHQCYALHLVLRWTDRSVFERKHPITAAHIGRFDRYQCCMALTALVRGERFCDGRLEEACRNGTVSRILRRLQLV